jgi:tetratricopeptide (TPR) repeat protein
MIKKAEELLRKGEKEAKVGKWDETKKFLAQVIEILDGVENRKSKGVFSAALSLMAYAQARLGEFHDGVTNAKEALEISSSIDDIEGETEALRRLGYIHWRKGDFDLALEFYDASLEKAESFGGRELIGLLKLEKGTTLNTMGKHDNSEALMRESIEILTEVGNLSEVMRGLNNLGTCLVEQKRWDDALECYLKAYEMACREEDSLRKGWSALNIAECATKMDDPDKSLEYLPTALELLEKIDDKIGLALTHLEFGLAYYGKKVIDKAERHLMVALIMFDKLKLPHEEALTHTALGQLFRSTGKKDLAGLHLERARKIYTDLNITDKVEEIEKLIKSSD